MDISNEQEIDRKISNLSSERLELKIFVFTLLGLIYIISYLPWNHLFDIDIKALYLLYFLLLLLAIQYYMQPYLTVKEEGKLVWIFEKYHFAPTCAKRLCQAKLLVLVRFCVKHLIITMLLQIISSLSRSHELTYVNFLPCTAFLFLFSLQALRIWYHANSKLL